MRIRSIHPEFWRSEDVAAWDWHTRLVFIGLWSYVDDNGVGRDVEKLIAAELFPLEENPRDTLASVSRGLQTLSAGGQITRYTVDSKPFLYVTAWSRWQKIDRPGKSRYPLPTCDDAEIRETLATPSRDTRETPSTGEGEKGRRGEVKKTPSSADADAAFDEFWALYPRKVGKVAAKKAWTKATKTATPDRLMSGLRSQLPALGQADPGFRPHPSTWLNEGRWEDEVPGVAADGSLTPEVVAEVLGRDTFQLPDPPAGLEAGSPSWRAWAVQARDEWQADRERRARVVLARRREAS